MSCYTRAVPLALKPNSEIFHNYALTLLQQKVSHLNSDPTSTRVCSESDAGDQRLVLLIEHWKAAHTGGPAQSNSGNTQLAGGENVAIGKIDDNDVSVGLVVMSQSNTT